MPHMTSQLNVDDLILDILINFNDLPGINAELVTKRQWQCIDVHHTWLHMFFTIVPDVKENGELKVVIDAHVFDQIISKRMYTVQDVLTYFNDNLEKFLIDTVTSIPTLRYSYQHQYFWLHGTEYTPSSLVKFTNNDELMAYMAKRYCSNVNEK
jgi:hypothetical protein